MRNAQNFLSFLMLLQLSGAGSAAALVTVTHDLVQLKPTLAGWVGLQTDGAVARSTDGGNSFSVVLNPASGDRYAAIGVRDAVVVAVGTDGIVARSSDQGMTWQDVSTATPILGDLRAVAHNGGSHWLAVGEDGFAGAVYRSTNDAGSWQKLTGPADVVLNDVVWNPSQNRWIAVGGSFLEGKAFASTDGQNWTSLALDSGSQDLLAVAVDPSGAVLAVGRGGEIQFMAANASAFARISGGPTGDLTSVLAMASGAWRIGGEGRLVVAYTRAGSRFTTLQTGEPGDPAVTDLVAFGEDLYLAGEFLALSASGLRIETLAGGTVEVIYGLPTGGVTYFLETSTDFATWIRVDGSDRTPSAGMRELRWTVAPASGPTQTFWRVRP